MNVNRFTPKYIFEPLGHFDLDPCTAGPSERPYDIANNNYWINDNENMIQQDGLKLIWSGRVWLNPPYSETGKWLKKMAEHNNGIALIFSKHDTKWFHEYVWKKASGILFLNKRVKFYNEHGQLLPSPRERSCLVSYDKGIIKKNRAVLIINESKLNGKFFKL